MKNQKISCFQSNYISPIGKAISIIASWEQPNKLSCERFTFFEKNNGTFCERVLRSTKENNTNGKISQSEFGKMQDTVESIKRIVESDIQVLLDTLTKGTKDHSTIWAKQITLSEIQIIPCLIYLKSKLPKSIDWLKKTEQKKLKNWLVTLDSIKFQEKLIS